MTFLRDGKLNQITGQVSGTPVTNEHLEALAASGDKAARRELEKRQIAKASRKAFGARMIRRGVSR